MSNVSISDLVVDPTVQIRRSAHETTVTRYMEVFDLLPPSTVVRAKEGLILADGFLRVAAASRLGRKDVPVIIRNGTRDDALEIAVVANTKNGEPLTIEERDAGILRLHGLHHTNRDIAKEMSVSHVLVGSVLAGAKVGRSVVVTSYQGERPLSISQCREIARADERQWQPLAEAAVRRGWSPAHVALAVKNLNQREISASHKQALLAGKVNPVVLTEDGEVSVPTDLAEREVRARQRNDALSKLDRAMEALAALRTTNIGSIVSLADGDRRDRMRKELPGDIKFLQNLLHANSSAKLRVVS